jgi:hypothetical protein
VPLPTLVGVFDLELLAVCEFVSFECVHIFISLTVIH